MSCRNMAALSKMCAEFKSGWIVFHSFQRPISALTKLDVFIRVVCVLGRKPAVLLAVLRANVSGLSEAC